jgi:hypothetical protein
MKSPGIVLMVTVQLSFEYVYTCPGWSWIVVPGAWRPDESRSMLGQFSAYS